MRSSSTRYANSHACRTLRMVVSYTKCWPEVQRRLAIRPISYSYPSKARCDGNAARTGGILVNHRDGKNLVE